MSVRRSSPLAHPLRTVLVLAFALVVIAVTVVGSTVSGSDPAGARTTPTTARRSTATTARRSTATTARKAPATTVRPTTVPTTVPAGDDHQAAAELGPPSLLVSGPEVAAASSRRDLLLSPAALWGATGAFAAIAVVVGACTARFWRRTRPS